MTTIKYKIPRSSHVEFKVFDLRGRLVVTRVDGIESADDCSIQFANPDLPSGAYFYKFTVGDFSLTRKRLLI